MENVNTSKLLALIQELQKEEGARKDDRPSPGAKLSSNPIDSKGDERTPSGHKSPENKKGGDSSSCENEGIAIASKNGKFRFCRQRGHFVYKHHIDKDYLREFFTELNRGHKLKLFIAAHESGDKSHPYEHTHVIIDFGRLVDFKGADFANIKLEGEPLPGQTLGLGEEPIKEITEVHPWIGGPRDDAHWKSLIRYMAKEDKDNASWKNYAIAESTPGSFAEQVWAQKSLQEALSKYGDDESVVEIIALWNAKPAPKLAERKWMPISWQKDCLERLKGKGNSRFVNWYVDESGAAGKSALTRAIIQTFPKDAVFIKGNGLTSKDMARLLKNEHNRGNSLRIIVFDLPRTMVDSTTSLYTMLEACADGMVSSGKYDSDNLLFDPEHVVVFANFMPAVNLLSKDRWKIHKLSWKDGSIDPPTAWASYANAVLDMPSDLTEAQRDEALTKHTPNITCTLIRLNGSSGAACAEKTKETISTTDADRADNIVDDSGLTDQDIEQLLEGMY